MAPRILQVARMSEGWTRRIVAACGVVVAAGAVAAAIHSREARVRSSAAPAPALAPEPLDVEISGCRAVVRAPACEVSPDAELRLFVAGPVEPKLRVAFDGREVPFRTTAWPDGRTLFVKALAGGGATKLRVSRGERESWEMPVVAAGGQDESAALSRRARVEFTQGHIDEAAAHLREAIALHAADERDSEAAEDASTLVFLLLERGRYGEVRPLLAQMAELSRDFPDGRALVTYFEGMLAWYTGDVRLALTRAREAREHATRLGAIRLRRMATQLVARALLDLGRTREALDQFRALLATDGDDMSPCDRADLQDNVGWAGALIEAGGDRAPDIDPRAPLRQAIDGFHASCPDPNRIANALENLALAELNRGRLAQATAALDEATNVQHDPAIPVVLFRDHLAGLIALASGDPSSATTAFVREAQVAEALGSGEDQRLAAEDRATALTAAGARTEALAVLDAADALLDADGAFIPLGEGKETFFGTRRRASALQVSLLVDLRRDVDAMRAARRARVRVLAGLRGRAALESLGEDARGQWEEAFERFRSARQAIDADAAHDWELSQSRLAAALEQRKQSSARARATLDDAVALLSRSSSAPAPRTEGAPHALREGEIELLYFPTDQGWLGFVRDAKGVRARKVGAIDPGSPGPVLSAALLEPFASAIAAATRVRLLLSGQARAIDVHALPWRGEPLEAHAVVEYVLGLGDAPLAPAAADDDRALVVADPNGDLPLARAEADAVVRALSAADDGAWKVDVLRGADARGDAVRAGLARARILHYAGHADFGGPDGMEGELSLAGGSALTPGDILALPRVPALVALFGCETGSESASGTSDSLGIAHAFLTAGTSGVIATSRAVDDALARDVAARLYPRLGAPPGPLDAAGALRGALMAVRAQSPGADWSAFRALVR
jgi:tetratricopeptide (TPR) repeat protein